MTDDERALLLALAEQALRINPWTLKSTEISRLAMLVYSAQQPDPESLRMPPSVKEPAKPLHVEETRKEPIRTCETCAHSNLLWTAPPCCDCTMDPPYPRWTPKPTVSKDGGE